MSDRKHSRFEIYTDGGGEQARTAASAALIREGSGEPLRCFVMFLGGATNNEAEISAILLGLSAFRALDLDPRKSIDWFADSEYTLKSATQWIHGWQKNGWRTADKKPVKNQGLWRCYLALAERLQLIPHHVRGHSGHEENELCDAACNWAKIYGAEALEGRASTNVTIEGSDGWLLVDGRNFLSRLREDLMLTDEDFHSLVPALVGGGIVSGDSQLEGRAIARVLKDLEELSNRAEKGGARGAELAQAIRELKLRFSQD